MSKVPGQEERRIIREVAEVVNGDPVEKVKEMLARLDDLNREIEKLKQHV